MAEKILSEVDAAKLIAEVNDRLRAAQLRVTVEVRGKGQNLCLRAVFPPKPGENGRARQTRHSLDRRALTRQDIRIAEQIAQQVAIELNTGMFDWRNWSDWEDEPVLAQKLVGDWVEELRQNYFDTRGNGAAVLNTWRANYQSSFRTLPLDHPLTPEVLYEWVLKNTKPGTSSRNHYCTAAKALAKIAGIEISFTGIAKRSCKAVNPRSIPSDTELLAIRDGLSDPGWKYLFGLQLAYGLRNHEMLLIDLSPFPRIRVIDGKTGPRTVTPVLREWAEAWELQNAVLPKIKYSDDMPLSRLGALITRGYDRLKVPTPYTIRHAFARRCLEVGLDPSMGAKLMGHSLNVHVQTYRAWVSEEVFLEAIERSLQK